jgi:16S rRNA (uracil1498-N3)-methyltransferase
LTLGTAFPKGERTDWLIEKAVELGVARLAPLKTARSVAAAGEGKLERLERKIVEACKQCRRDWLMELAAPTPLADFLASKPPAVVGWLLDPSGEPADGRCDWAAVGPEGGFTAAELEAAHATGWKIVALPGHILRIETACLAVAAKALSGGL